MAKRFQVSILDLGTKEFVEKKSFDKLSEAEDFKCKTLEKDPHLVVGIEDTLAKPAPSDDTKVLDKDKVEEMPKAKIIKTKSSIIEIDKNGKEWKITSSKLSRPLTTESVIKATGYLTRIAKRLDLASAATALEHAKNIGKYVIAGDTYGPSADQSAFTSPALTEPVSAITSEKPYEVFCDTCNIVMVKDTKSIDEGAKEVYTCPQCQWKADMDGIQEPSLESDPTNFPLSGPSDYERGGNAFLNSANYKGNGFTVKAVDEEKKEEKKQKESGLDTGQRSAINSKLEDANKKVREYLVNVQVITQEVKNYQAELVDALGLKELKKQAELMEPAIKEMLDQLAEHEKQVQGVEYRLADAHKRTSLKSREEVDPILKEIEKLVSKKNLEEFEALRQELYKTSNVKESFTYGLAKQSPEVDKDVEEVKKTIELLKSKKDLPKEEIEAVEEADKKEDEVAGKASVSIDSRIDALATAQIIDEEVAKGLKESYKKDPKKIRKELRKLEAKIIAPEVEFKPIENEDKGKEETKEKATVSNEVKEYSYRTFLKDVSGVSKEHGGTGEIKEGTKVFINGIQDDLVTFSDSGTPYVVKMDFIKENTKSASKKKASLNIFADDMSGKIAKYWESVKTLFKEVLKPFTNFLTISNAEWSDVNEKLDEAFGNIEGEPEMVKASSLKNEAAAPIAKNLVINVKNVVENKELVENKLNEYEVQGLISSWDVVKDSIEKDETEYRVVLNTLESNENTQGLLIQGLRTQIKENEFFVKEASLNKSAADEEIKFDDEPQELQFEKDKDSDYRVLNTWDQNGYAEVFTFLDELKESGETNMYGARPYIIQEFDCEAKVASKLLNLWMKFYGDGSKPAQERAKEAFAFNQGDLFKKDASLNKQASKVSISDQWKAEGCTTIKIKLENGESGEDLVAKLKASDGTMEDIKDINEDEDAGIVYIQVMTSDSDEALDIVNGALGIVQNSEDDNDHLTDEEYKISEENARKQAEGK